MMGMEHLAEGKRARPGDHRDPLWVLIVRGLRWQTGGVVLASGLMLAVVYAACGYLGWWLEYPGIGSFVIWPGAGIAVAMLLGSGRRIWFGVPLGIFLLEFWMRHVDPAPGRIGLMMRMPWVAALAATVQAVLATALIRWRFDARVRLTGPRDAIILLMLAGPISCAVSAAIGVAGLHADGLVPVPMLFKAAARIWLGASLGVAVFLPLGLVTLAPERAGYGVLWMETRLRHLLTPLASFVLLSGVFLSAFLANAIAQSNERSHDKMFVLAATRNEASVQHEFASLKAVLDDTSMQVAMFPKRTFTSWREFVHPSLVYRLRGLEDIGTLFMQTSTSSATAQQMAPGSLTVESAVPYQDTGLSKPLRLEPSKAISLAARASVKMGNPVATRVLVNTSSGKPEQRIMLVEPVTAFPTTHIAEAKSDPAGTRLAFLLLDPDNLVPSSDRPNGGAYLARIDLSSLIGPGKTHPETIETASTLPIGHHRTTTRLVVSREWWKFEGGVISG